MSGVVTRQSDDLRFMALALSLGLALGLALAPPPLPDWTRPETAAIALFLVSAMYSTPAGSTATA